MNAAHLPLALRLAARDLRGGLRGLRVVLACLALGVAAIAAVGGLRAGVDRGLADDGRRILGGDLDVETGVDPAPAALLDWLTARGARLSRVVTMRAMLVAPSGTRLLVELKAVDAAWPLVGTATLDPPRPVAAALADQDGHAGLLAEAAVAGRLGVQPGALLRLGNTTVRLRGTLAAEPDRVASPSILGPRALVPLSVLPASGLIQPGSIVEHHLRVVLPDGVSVAGVLADVRAAFPGRGWRLRDTSNAAPGVNRFIAQTSLFLTLAGLTALLVGGIGVANGVRAWRDARGRTIAILRCLGAPARLVFAVCLIQVMALAGLGALIGLAVGAALPPLAAWALRDVLPVVPVIGLFAGPLALAAACGLLTAGAFALPPLAGAMRIPGAALFRDAAVPVGGRPPGAVLAATAVLAAALAALVVATAEQKTFAAGFCVAALATLGLFRAAAWGLMRLAAIIPPPRSPGPRLGLANLHRPGAATPLLLVSIGLGLTTLSAIALIEGNLRRQVEDQLPADAPTFFFVDLQPGQITGFRDLLAGIPGVGEVRDVPSLRARMVAVNGVPAEQVHASPDTAWALRGDRGLTYAAAPPDGTRLTAGAWWPPGYRGPPLVSFDAGLARGWGVGVGDTLRVNVLGRDLDLRIASLRDISWRAMGLNFTLVASPGLLDQAPHTHIATVRADPAAQEQVLRAVTDAYPNVSGIRIADVLAAVAALLGQLGTALSATASLTLAAGILVLAGAVAAGQRRRQREAVILKTLGATRAQVRAAWLTEFGVLGAVAGLLAALVGTGASLAVMRLVMRAEWAFLPGTLGCIVAGAVVLMLLLGYGGIELAMRAKAATILRNP